MLGARGLEKQLPARKGRILAEHGIERETGFGAQDPATKKNYRKKNAMADQVSAGNMARMGKRKGRCSTRL